ncbi:hypothetical protein DF024_36000 [Burkholderia cenocepacia]|nr:hypothetical protein DF024_36000 [Burkholderia cenocepacia]
MAQSAGVMAVSLGDGPCSGLMNPDTDLGENVRHEEVSDEQATTYVFPGVQTASRLPGARPGL